MTEEALRHTDQVLLELVDMVETARAVPMSSSVVVPRERMLDLLDELRETMPPEMDEARKLIATRDQVLYGAHTEATAVREKADADAQAIIADARAKAAEIAAHADAEHRRRVADSEVVRAAAGEADRVRDEAGRHTALLRQDAEAYADKIRGEADRHAQRVRGEAEAYARQLRTDAAQYAEKTLADLGGVLQRAAATAEQGRAALIRRREESATGHGGTERPGHPSAISA